MKTKPKKLMPSPQNDAFEQERERLLRSMLSSVSHDLKTPLACIIGSLETYERTKTKLSQDKKDTLLHTALAEAYRLDSFISNILDMNQLENGAVKVKKETCMMDYLLEDCLIMLGHRLSKCTVSIKAKNATFPITTDPALLMRVICIVLDNAAKYCSTNVAIHVEYEKVRKQVFIHIHDDGSGVPKAKHEEIFSKYTRLALEDRQLPGTGLGLPICRAIMRLLGGTVTVSNPAKGKGSVFTLAFAA